MRRELSALVARSPFGQGAAWPVVQTVQRDGICVEVIAPAPGLHCEIWAAPRRQLGLRLADELGVVGVLAVELFETADGGTAGQRAGDAPAQLGALEHGRRTAPVSSNSTCGRCWTTRSGDTAADRAGDGDGQCARRAARRPAMTMDERLHHLFARMPDAKVHLYGKSGAGPQDRAREHPRCGRRRWTMTKRAFGRYGSGRAGAAH